MEEILVSKNNLTIFMHIPKTGGTTLNKIFKKQYNFDEIYDHDSFKDKMIEHEKLTKEEKGKLKAVAGHYLYGIDQFFAKEFNYFTMLRDPVDRVISLYYFLQNYPGYERVKKMTLEEYVLKEAEAYNFQTVMVSGIPIKPDLEKAKENLKTFTVVGLTEFFNESLFLLKKAYGWNDIHYKKHNITKKRLKKEELPSTVINLIKKYNELDLELYDFSKQLMAKQLQTLTPDERKQLEQFKKEQDLLS